MSKKRITVTLDEDLDRKIRALQVSLISSTQRGWSYSSVLTILVKEGLEINVAKKMASKKAR